MLKVRMAAVLSRPQVVAFVALVLIWTFRMRWSDLDGDFNWVKDQVHASASSSASPPSSTDSQVTTGGNNAASTLPGGPSSHHYPPGEAPSGSSSSDSSAVDVSAIDFSDPDAPFISWPLARTCSEVTSWAEGVVFLCDNNFGGVGNVRNFILTCVRYAIEAGAAALVMPRIRKRDDSDIKEIMDRDDFRPFSYLFDERNFREAMAANCPQMTIYDTWEDVPHVRRRSDGSGAPEVETLDPREVSRKDTARCDFAELDHHTDRFHYTFRDMLQNAELGPPPNASYPRLFRGNDWPGVLWEFPVFRDGPEFANTFGGLCKFHPTILQLGKKALARMEAYAQGHNNKKAASSSSDDAAAGAGAGAGAGFLGIHLRTEADRLKFWPTYEDQEKGYLAKAAELGLSVGYVASGDVKEARKLAAAAKKAVGVTMVSKEDILDAADLKALHALSWDQQGLVDYIVLVGAEYFMGNGRSSFSISVTKKRHLKADGLYSRPYKVRPDGYGRSFIVGPMRLYYEDWLFIWDAMWP